MNRPSSLKSPTCRDCARAWGLVPVAEVFTAYHGACANCGEEKTVSTASDWRRPGERVSVAVWD